jgi:hypothetical protein
MSEEYTVFSNIGMIKGYFNLTDDEYHRFKELMKSMHFIIRKGRIEKSIRIPINRRVAIRGAVKPNSEQLT